MKEQYPDFQREVTHAVCCPILTMKKQIPQAQQGVCSFTAQQMWNWIYGKTFGANQKELKAIQQYLKYESYTNYVIRFIQRGPKINEREYEQLVLDYVEKQGQDLMISFAPDHHILMKKHRDIWIVFQSWVGKFTIHQYSEHLRAPKFASGFPLKQWRKYILWFLNACLDRKFNHWDSLFEYFQNQAQIHSMLIWTGQSKSFDTVSNDHRLKF